MRIVGSLACCFSVGAVAAAEANVSVAHGSLTCVVAERLPRIEATIAPAEELATVRVHFRSPAHPAWYSVSMHADSGAFVALLPKPRKSLKAFVYYIEATSKDLTVARTAEFTPEVVSGPGACAGRVVGASLASAAVFVTAPAGLPLVPAGFSSAGVVGASVSASGAAGATAAGGASGGNSILAPALLVGAGAAGVGAALALKQDNAPAEADPTAAEMPISFSTANTNITCANYPGSIFRVRVQNNSKATLRLDQPNVTSSGSRIVEASGSLAASSCFDGSYGFSPDVVSGPSQPRAAIPPGSDLVMAWGTFGAAFSAPYEGRITCSQTQTLAVCVLLPSGAPGNCATSPPTTFVAEIDASCAGRR